MKHLLLVALATSALITACDSNRDRDTTTTTADNWQPAPDTVYVNQQPQVQPVIIMPSYYGASYYASQPQRYYTDPHSAYFDTRSSAYHRSYSDEFHAEHRVAGTVHQNAAAARALYQPTTTAKPRAYAAPRAVTTTKPSTYSGFSSTPSRTYTTPTRVVASPAPAARTYSAPTPARTYTAPVRVSAPARVYSAPTVHATYSAPHISSTPHVSVSAHH